MKVWIGLDPYAEPVMAGRRKVAVRKALIAYLNKHHGFGDDPPWTAGDIERDGLLTDHVEMIDD